MAIVTDKINIMKKLVILAGLFLMAASHSYGQRTVEKGGYLKDPNLSKFAGTWQGTSGPDTLTIVFEEQKVYYEKPDVHMDRILGWHKYVEAGQEIESFLNLAGSSYESSTFSGATNDDNSNRLDLNVKDYKRDRILDATFQLNPGQPDQAILKLRVSQGVYFYFGDEKPKKDVRALPVPSTWKMEKIK